MNIKLYNVHSGKMRPMVMVRNNHSSLIHCGDNFLSAYQTRVHCTFYLQAKKLSEQTFLNTAKHARHGWNKALMQTLNDAYSDQVHLIFFYHPYKPIFQGNKVSSGKHNAI